MPAQIFHQNKLSLYNNLVNADPERLYHEQHKYILAHPADILNDALKLLVDTHEKAFVSRDDDTPQFVSEPVHLKQLIYSIDEFHDALALIIKCFTPPSETDNQNAILWLKEQKSNIHSSLLGATNLLHEDFKKMANRLKHDHAKIALTKLTNHNNVEVSGFYIQVAVGAENQLGPAPDIHKKYKSTVSTAFSLNHLLLRSIGFVLSCLTELNKSLFPKHLTSNNTTQHNSSHFFSLLKIGSKISPDFFPDEYLRSYAKIKTDNSTITIDFPFRYKKRAGENFDKIISYCSPIAINIRTSSSNAVIPYLPLMYPDVKNTANNV